MAKRKPQLKSTVGLSANRKFSFALVKKVNVLSRNQKEHFD